MIELPFLVRQINKRLKFLFGVNIYGSANFRIVYSDNEFEKRRGSFNEFLGKIFLRQIVGIRECKKYPHLKERFIIERWYPADKAFTPEIPDSINGGYEPLYVFEDKDRNFLDPIERVAIIVCSCAIDPINFWKRKQMLEEYASRQDKEDYDAVYYGIETTPIQLALATGQGITVPKEIK